MACAASSARAPGCRSRTRTLLRNSWPMSATRGICMFLASDPVPKLLELARSSCVVSHTLVGDDAVMDVPADMPKDGQEPPPEEDPSQPGAAPRLTGTLGQLSVHTQSEAMKVFARLHRNLGHPTCKDLHKVLKDKGASQAVLQAALTYKSATCLKLAPPPQSTKATLHSTFRFNERLLADTIWLQVQGRPVPVVTMLDAATKYMSARVVKRETTSDFISALEHGWLRVFPSLHVDSHRAWGSDAFRDFTTDHDLQLTISPGEAHNRSSLSVDIMFYAEQRTSTWQTAAWTAFQPSKRP